MSIPNELAWYKLDDDAADTTVADASGNRYHGTASSNTSTLVATGKIDGGLDFGGTDYVSIANGSPFNFAGAFTIAMWAKPAATAAYGGMAYRYDSTSGDGFNVYQYTSSSGRWQFAVYIGGSTVTIYSDASPSGDWQHLVCVRESDGTMKMYVGGVLQADVKSKSGAIDSTGNLLLAATYGGGARFDGVLDDMRFYADALTQEQINALYNSGNGTDKSLAELFGVYPKNMFCSPVFHSPVIG